MSNKSLLFLMFGLLSAGCASGGFDENDSDSPVEQRAREVVPKFGMAQAQGALGSSCATGCIWSSYAVSLGAQLATHTCGSLDCACVADGNIYISCVVNQSSAAPGPSWDDPFAPQSNPAGAVSRVPGATCAPNCIWSTLAVYLNFQEASSLCQDSPCACVVNNNAWLACNPSSGGGQSSQPQPQAQAQPQPQAPPRAGSAAQQIVDSHNARRLTLWNQSFGRYDGADPLSNLKDAAAGRPAKTSCYGTAPCNTVRLSDTLLESMRDITSVYGLNYFVTSVAGAAHSYGSLHYAGRAVDFDEVNGVLIRGDSPQARSLMAACRALGAIEVLGPSNDPAGHRDHVHCAW